jgi:undecaprenyl-diphosphatase
VNYQLFQLINAGAGRWATIDHVLRFSAEYLVYLVFSAGGAIVVFGLTQRHFRRIASLGGTLALTFVLAEVLLRTSHQLRPFQSHAVRQLVPAAPGVSLPSGHATAAFAVAFAVLVFFDRPAGIMLTAAAALIGFAQVWTGVHYPGDIMVAAVIAGLSAFSVYVIGRGPRPADIVEPAVSYRP